jgi:predicted DNA-binding transcriptional regulator AlpA
MAGFIIAATTRGSAKQEAEMSDQATMTCQSLNETLQRKSDARMADRNPRVSDYADSLWNYAQCADFLGMSENSLRKAAAEGRVPRLKIGRLVRFSPAAMRKWAEKNMRKSNGETAK